MTAEARCGEWAPTPDGRGLGCCRELHHAGSHCVHTGDELTGTPGLIVASRSGPRFKPCDGTRGGQLPVRHPGRGRLAADDRAQRRWAEHHGAQPEEGEPS